MGVLVCMAMHKLPGRAPRAPSALTAPAQPLHALPGSQIPSSAGLQPCLSQPNPGLGWLPPALLQAGVMVPCGALTLQWSYAALVVYLRSKWNNKNNFTN